ncbi:anthranilate synthase component 1 [Celerinatantimonas yamalensis]|uniref:Anthranilate synthase component 1 n=1 Tax=Celerinatantimonas yamalensis TaxID=559956 RepID=A0ABW9G2M2_9GAMM
MTGHKPSLTNIIEQVNYVDDPLALYQQLYHSQQESVLLESAEIDSKADLKSLILLDCAVKITCHGRQVCFQAMTDNGKQVVAVLAEHFIPSLISDCSQTRLTLDFPRPAPDLDEDSRLKALSPVTALRELISLYGPLATHPEGLFIGGAFSFDFIASFEQLLDVAKGDNQLPDFQFYLAETLLIIDHQTQRSELIGSLFGNHPEYRLTLNSRFAALREACQNPTMPVTEQISAYHGKVTTDLSDAQYGTMVAKLKESIINGDIFQVVPSRCFYLECPNNLAAYRQLKQNNPSPYMFFLNDPEFAMFGASPESAIKYSHDSRQVEIYPIAGTRPRGRNPDGTLNLDLDGRLELELRMDKKETAEHLMLVDLARNDVARISNPGSRHVANLLKVDRYSHVMHLVSRVVGTLRDDLDALHAYQASMNMGTLTGAPKISAAQLIRQHEGKRRGSYGGAVGYLTGNGSMDTCIVIRSAFVKDGVAQIQAGAGVVYDSIPQAEADETRTKAAAVINAIACAHGSTLAEVSRG